MTITDTTKAAADQYAALAGTTRSATEKSMEMWKSGAQVLADRANKMPRVDVSKSVERYFELVQRAVDVNRDLAATWADAVTSMTGVFTDQAKSLTGAAIRQTEHVADVVVEQAEHAEQVAKDEAAQVEAAEKDAERQARAEERRQAKEAHQQARAPYEGKTKAELSDLLAERDLAKTGNLDELVERLVEDDTK